VKRALLLALLVAAPALAGCADDDGASRDTLVPYPRMGDEATYRVDRYVEIARWENGHVGPLDVRFRVQESAPVLDAARAAYDAFRVSVEAGGAKQADLFVSPAHEALVQAVYPLAGDQSIVAFDERGFPWLFGASALFGENVAQGRSVAFVVPDTLGGKAGLALRWVSQGAQSLDGRSTTKLVLEGNDSIAGALWLDGSAWPLRASLTIKDASVAPLLRIDGELPATMDARRVALAQGKDPVPPRNRAASFGPDPAAAREAWDGFAPPDGPDAYETYTLGAALADAKLLDPGAQQWLKGASDPRLYRATFKTLEGPAQGTTNATWLLVFVDKDEHYYAVQMGKLMGATPSLPAAPPAALPATGVPRVESSGPYAPPASANHGWFDKAAVPERLVPLSAGVKIVQQTFGAKGVEIFLRSFADPPGYAYFLDGGWDGEKGEKGRYTVVYDPNTGLLQEATGHGVAARFAAKP